MTSTHPANLDSPQTPMDPSRFDHLARLFSGGGEWWPLRAAERYRLPAGQPVLFGQLLQQHLRRSGAPLRRNSVRAARPRLRRQHLLRGRNPEKLRRRLLLRPGGPLLRRQMLPIEYLVLVDGDGFGFCCGPGLACCGQQCCDAGDQCCSGCCPPDHFCCGGLFCCPVPCCGGLCCPEGTTCCGEGGCCPRCPGNPNELCCCVQDSP